MFLNLYPDMSRKGYESNDTFVYAGPINANAWTLLARIAKHTPDNIPYLLPSDVKGLQDCLILRTGSMTDEDALTAQAYIRMVHREHARIYVVPPARGKHDMIAASAGSDPKLCRMVTLEFVEPKEVTNSK